MQRLIRRRAARTCRGLPQASHNLLCRNTSKVEALTPGQNRCREPLRLGGCQNKHHMGRWLLQRLQQRIKGRGRQHVYLVDDIDLVFAILWRILHRFAQVADLVHAVVAGRVDFQNVQTVFSHQALAAFAFPTGVALHRMQTVNSPCHDLGGGRFACSAGAAEQIRVRDPPGHDLVAQGGNNGLLPHHGAEILRPPLPVKCLIGHGLSSYLKQISGRRASSFFVPMPLTSSRSSG